MSLHNLPPGVPASRICHLNKDGSWTIETEAHYEQRMLRYQKWRDFGKAFLLIAFLLLVGWILL